MRNEENSTLGNGLHYDRIISEVTGRVMAVTSGIGADTQVQFHEYTYDLLGQVKTRLDHMMGRSESYTYDGLNRLVGYNLSTVSPIIPGVPAATPMQLAMQYDALGNITHKSDVGAYYYAPGRPHAVASVYNASSGVTRNYTYDANGNQLTGPGRTLEWSAANQVKKITGGGKTTEFLFGASRERIVQKQSGGATTIYVGALFEVVLHAGGLREEKYHIHTPLGRTATRTLRSDSLVETRYYHQDALGSIVAVSDEYGRVEKRFAYDPWGVRETPLDTRVRDGGEVTRGFTDHEHLDDFGLIHMNGRVFDPVLARFLSPDPFIGDAGDAQSYNRYSYVNNNPLNAIDPSGYFALKDIIKIVVCVVVCIIVTIVTYGAGTGVWVGMGTITAQATVGAGAALAAVAAGGFAGAFVGALMDGASVKQAFRAGLVGAFTSFAGSSVGIAGQGMTGKLDTFIFKVGAHGLAGGVAAEIGGGEFKHGFVNAAAAAGLDCAGWNVPDGDLVSGSIRKGIAGGTISVIGGGKFANGAYTAATTHLVSNGVSGMTDGMFAPNMPASTDSAGTDVKLSQGIYEKGFAGTDGYTMVGDPYINDKNGLNAAVFSNGTDNVLVFAGTTPGSWANWKANLLQAFGFKSSQYEMGIKLAEKLYDQYNGNLRFAGHSLGGGIASAAAIITGGSANTYNAAGVHNNTLSGHSRTNSAITRYYSAFDLLRIGNGFTPSAVVGSPVSLGAAGFHGINGMVNAFK